MYRISVCDDDKTELEKICGIVGEYVAEKSIPAQIRPFDALVRQDLGKLSREYEARQKRERGGVCYVERNGACDHKKVFGREKEIHRL